MPFTMYAKDISTMHFAFDEIGHWSVKDMLVTENKALTRVFQAKHIPRSLWNSCDQTLQFNFVLTHIPGVGNPAIAYFSRLEERPEERVHMKWNDSIAVYHIEIDIASNIEGT